jgi:chitin disaccharide deacetylase
MSPCRHLIVNADDFGLSAGVNRGISRAHEHGIVTSASLMVRGSAASQAAAYAQAHPKLSVGLHVDLGEWAYMNDAWHAVYEVVPADDQAAVADEIARQLDAFRLLMGRNPTHLDSHQHVHHDEPSLSLLTGVARQLGVVLRSTNPLVRYCGDFYGQTNKGDPYHTGISIEALLRCIHNLPEGVTELGCHPGEGTDVYSVYRDERAIECRTLCDPRIKDAIAQADIKLCSFAELECR